MTEKEFYVLLEKFLSGKATTEEKKLLKKFEEHFITKNQDIAFESDLKKRQIKKEIFTKIKRRIRAERRNWMKVAASIIILLGMGYTFLYYQDNNIDFIIVTNTSDETKKIELKDGSVIILNKGSEIKYKEDFNQKDRYVALNGEAFFEVVKNIEKPFIVKTGNLSTKVLGTSFNIEEIDSITKVTVASGLVKVFDSESSVNIKPNQQAVYHLKSKSLLTKNISYNLYTGWFKDIAVLENVSMKELADFLTSIYQVNFNFSSTQAQQHRMSITIDKNDSLVSIVKGINFISEVELTQKRNNMIEVELKN
ncbi:MAG: FecR family protein [Flavobacteriaceae bacterium]|nr:FecR family protein [Flavobacteriaceae bacterium]